MRFLLDAEQRAFAASLDALLAATDTPAVIRDWSRGDHASGRALWSRVADAGVFALAVPEAYEGLGPRPVELAVAFVELGRHAVPGPLVETVTAAALLTGADPGTAKRLLPALASGETMATVAPEGAYALDGDAAALRISWEPGRIRLAVAAQALGVGLALLDRTVGYVKQRTQFGVPVGSFQAVKHRLADAKIALEFARPLVFGAALTMEPADAAAAKAAACEAAYTTARTALQLHGAIGYTAEYGLSLWLAKARALRTAWGAPEECRALVVSAGDRRR